MLVFVAMFEIKTPTKHVEAAIRVISGRGFDSPRLHWYDNGPRASARGSRRFRTA